ncbi:MAG TPA: Ku protein [Acidimicrobiia bacterium]|nr:Ku protein [Acidimicrobiia bacterium]
MPPRAIWSGAISFGLVNVPVKVTAAVSKKDIRFHMLHAKDGARIEQRRVCTADGEEVAWDDLAKGYELAPGQHIVIQPHELDDLDPDATRTIDILDFVDEDQIDPIYYQHAYYLIPDKKTSEKPYALLREAMQQSGKVAIARFVMRTKEYLAAVRPRDDALVLSTMLFADEVVPVDGVEGLPGSGDLDKKELAMAEQLIAQLTTEFDPSRYEDHYRQRVEDLIEAKAKGEVIVTQPAKEQDSGGVVDLVAALEASLAEAERGEKRSRRPKRRSA